MKKTKEIKYHVKVPLKRYFPIIGHLFLGISLSLILFFIIHSWELKNLRSEFEFMANVQANAVESTLQEYMGALLFLGDFFNISVSHPTRQQFAHFGGNVMPRYPGIQAFSWNPLVMSKERIHYESEAKKEGFVDFEFTERSDTNGLVRASNRKEYVIVYYIHTLKANRPAFGFDIASDEIRMEAITKGFSTGNPTATSRVTLVQEKENQFGVLLLLPVYHQGAPLNTPEERWKQRKGFVVEVLRIGKAVETALEGFSSGGIDMSVT